MDNIIEESFRFSVPRHFYWIVGLVWIRPHMAIVYETRQNQNNYTKIVRIIIT